MTNILSLIPGQTSLSNYIASSGGGGGGGGGDPDYWTSVIGQYTKIEGYQYNYTFATSATQSNTFNHMPFPYSPTATGQADSVFGELDRKKWLRGILLELEWGRIETAPGVFNWEFVDWVFETIRTLPKSTGQGKKVLLLINLRHVASLVGLGDFIPDDLLTQPTENGGYYKPTATYPPSATNPIENAKKYHHCWCYIGALTNNTGFNEPKGYNFNMYKFTTAAGTNTLKTRFYAFLDAIATRYGNDSVFAGMVTTEAAMGTPFETIIGSAAPYSYESGNGRNQNYDGRREIAKRMRTIFPNHIVAECVNFDETYYNDMTGAGKTDGLITHRLAFTTANIHLGTNMNLGNIRPVLDGKIPIVMQIQPLDMRTKSGNRPQYFDWPNNPTVKLNGDGINYNDPASMQFLFDRLTYYKANLSIIQRNFEIGSPNWIDWKAYMDASIHANSASGGMLATKPQIVT